ncbi:small, acid-soluble spore protein C2 [Oxobacter pfennigii]|uniref:Small, acid-soluble spore protein C2 n=1 Tax=Oxobacter pfennigii TaxID=36849 RepID=A0A0P9AF33_9CLOT|nr:alpha/beta-type small acid-soluble spore protein [Oxobacter pfennigii]KPU43964.1 small, acid-soluble spore protein C2 [Oxobacter pfennigii]
MSRNNHVVPEASSGLDKMKFEVAREVGVDLKDGYNGDILSRDAGRIGGNMVKKMIEAYERSLANNK